MRMKFHAAAYAIPLAAMLAGCQKHANTNLRVNRAVGNADHGATLINYYGCGSCHTIPGIPDADGLVGPPLTDFSRRVYIAGVLRNTPDNLVAWIRDPQRIVPGNVMPKMGIDAADARDIAAYLYTIR
jgi:cytochrome c2